MEKMLHYSNWTAPDMERNKLKKGDSLHFPRNFNRITKFHDISRTENPYLIYLVFLRQWECCEIMCYLRGMKYKQIKVDWYSPIFG